jgi:hypothetical protein
MTERTGTNMDEMDLPLAFVLHVTPYDAYDSLAEHHKSNLQRLADPNYRREPLPVLPRNRHRRLVRSIA